MLGLLATVCLRSQTNAASGPEIDFEARATLDQLFHEVWSSHELANKALAILVFPTVLKAGFGIGGEYGEGALLIRGRNRWVLQHYFRLDRIPVRRTGALRHHHVHDG